MALLAGVFPAIWWLQWSVWNNPALDFLLLPSPVYTYLKGFDVRYRFGAGAREFWWSLVTIFGLAVGCIIAANLLLPRLWHEKNANSTRAPRQRLQPRLLLDWKNPAYWLTVRDESPRRFTTRLLLCLVPVWFMIMLASVATAQHIALFVSCFVTAYGLHQFVKVLIIAEASRRINQDRQSGALELLLVTPLPVRSLLAGQKAALRTHFAPALIILSLLNLALVAEVVAFPRPLQIGPRDIPVFCEIFIGGIIALIFDFHALGWVAMWRGLNAAKHQRAVGGTMLQVLGIPWLVVFFLLFLQPNFGPGSAAFVIGCWFGLGILVDLASAAIARNRLENEFRLAATFRSGTKAT